MKPFAYERPADAEAAIALLERSEGARYLAGGTNLVDLMKLEVETPPLLVDVRDLGTAIEETAAGGLRIGAGVTNSALAADRAVRERYPLLAQAVLAGASGQLRNVATVGGNLLQRTRCAYFQDVTKPCNKRAPGSGCPAREGEHRNHAVLGHSPACIATHPSDMAVALAALGATVHVAGPGGGREIPIPGLHRLPGDEPRARHGARARRADRGARAGAARSPRARPTARSATARPTRSRSSRSRSPSSSTATRCATAGSRSAGSRTSRGAPSARRRRCAAARPREDAFRAAADAELAAAEPLRDNAFKVPLARNVLVSTLAEVCS